MSMPNVDLIRATHDVIKAWGINSARAQGGPCVVLVPVPPGYCDIDALLKEVRRLEFVETAERFEWLRDQPGGDAGDETRGRGHAVAARYPGDVLRGGGAVIVKEGSRYVVKSEAGKPMGSYTSRAAAEKRLKQIEMHKHMNERMRGKG